MYTTQYIVVNGVLVPQHIVLGNNCKNMLYLDLYYILRSQM